VPAGPTRFAVRLKLLSAYITHLVDLSQQRCAMVIVVPSMAATGQRGLVQEPRPAEGSNQIALPTVWTNSMSEGLRHLRLANSQPDSPSRSW
jgi:hypothetical protein